MPTLKVFRTSTGFHDAYVAAPSQKAALAAWGADGNLFAQGLAEQVTDEALMAEPLAQPGVVIKKLRGTEAEHLAALGPMPEKVNRRSKGADESEQSSAPRPAVKVKTLPRPSRDALDAADAALAQAKEEQKAPLALINKKIVELRKDKSALEAKQDRERFHLEKTAKRERAIYDAALERWRD